MRIIQGKKTKLLFQGKRDYTARFVRGPICEATDDSKQLEHEEKELWGGGTHH